MWKVIRFLLVLPLALFAGVVAFFVSIFSEEEVVCPYCENTDMLDVQGMLICRKCDRLVVSNKYHERG